uniref:HTH OST-type domain-containing protein n=1 Tax=Nothobranchius furzeri TaxID=105023 RepID=A0A1A8UKW3_NOTFU
MCAEVIEAISTSQVWTKASLKMEEVLQNVVALVKQHQDGVPLDKLSVCYNQAYHRNLNVRALGLNSIVSLVSSLKDLVVEGDVVRHKDHCQQSQAVAGAECHTAVSAKALKASRRSAKRLKNLVALMKEHPGGIPLENVAHIYKQTYLKKLSPVSLGFKTMSCLVESLKEDLIVEGETVFHKTHLPGHQHEAWTSTNRKENSRPSTPHTPGSLRDSSPLQGPAPTQDATSHSVPLTQAQVSLFGPPLVASAPLVSTQRVPLVAAPEPPQQLTQDQLYQRVLQVLKACQPGNPSISELQTQYTHVFGEPFPLEQYISLYDNWEAKKLPHQPEPNPNPKTNAWQTAEATENLTRGPTEAVSGPNLLAENEFPVLGAAANPTHEKKTVKRATQREGGALVFREAYNAQLREVHGGNMRALEALEDEDDQELRRRSHCVDPDWINTMALNAIRDIAADGELVTKEKVISWVCSKIPNLHPRVLKPRNVPALKDLEYLMREVNMFIEATEALSSICTLYELGQALAGLKDKKHYEELNLGPLCKLPLVNRMFKIDSNTKDDEIHEIQTVDIIKQIRIFWRKTTTQKLDLAEFLKFLSDHYHCDSPYELGIRILSFGLAISCMNKVTRNENTIMERAREVIQKELEDETYERLRKIKSSVLDPVQGAGLSSSSGSSDLRKKYVSMPAGDVVLEVLSNAMGVFNLKMAKHVEMFLNLVLKDRLARALFQLAVCGGSLAVPQDVVLKEQKPKTTQQTNMVDRAAAPLPSEAKVKQYLKENLAAQSSATTLAHVAALEKKLAKHFNVKDFPSLEHGTFLEFLVKHIQLLKDTLGSALFLGNNTELTGSGFRPTRQDVFEFIKQCGNITSTDPDELSHIESALRSHYRVRDSRDLGYGSLHTLAGLLQRQQKLPGGGLSPVYYESALLAKNSKSSSESGSVGRLGEMPRDQALASLLSCPLLEDLNQWSQWELIFKPLHGSLKDFIERHAANTGLAALEVTPGLLLKITTDTGDKHFSSAAAALDPVGTAGHLVSMVAADGIDNAPTALLANHMENALAAAVAKEDVSSAEEDVTCYSRVATFLLTSLTRIPTRTCQALLQQVFLEPLSRVLGQAKSKEVLITVAQSDPKHLNCLHRLGVLLGITDWLKDYQKKLNPPLNQSCNVSSGPVDRAKPSLDSESSSFSAVTLSEEEDLEDDFSSVSSHLDLCQQPGLDKEEEEDLYELISAPNGTTSDLSSEADGGQAEELPESSESEESSQTENTFHHQRAIIEDIRKSEFGIGVMLNAEGQRLMQVHQERLGRSLDRLSTELYSKDTHFVLELIQNADDNSYPSDAGEVPALAFVVEKDCITVLNNEAGFQKNNIRAICDVGRSTKGKHKSGYIGQKGIGFKSVFKVTDCPEIHSNGFHLRFDKTCGPMGYILPHWAEEERPLDPRLKELHQHSWTTKISLPLRSESHQTRNLFHDVHPSLLLFLHRLRSITIYNESEKRLVNMTRKNLSHNVIEVEHTEGIERWLVVKTTIELKKIKEDVESTELALAFQLGNTIPEGEVMCQPQKQPVFAFLPLRSFGFRFIIQGDFDIPSSREDVDRDSPWNQRLRSEIPQLFLQAMDVFNAHPEFKGLRGLSQFLQFFPLPDEVMDFFKPVAGQIIQLLKGKAFLPTIGSDGQVVFKLPSQVSVCQDTVIRDVIGGDELERHLSLSYLHPGLTPPPPTSVLTHLGVRHLRGSDVTTVTTAMAKELMRAEGIQSEGSLRKLARLLVCNFRAMEHGYGEADSILQSLRELPIIPLANGQVVALNGEGVFFPMEEPSSNKKKGKAPTQSGPLSALYEDVVVVHPSLLNCLEALENQQVRELLKRLGVHELEPQELLEQHIYPTIRNNKWKSKSESVVVSYLVFIKQHSSSGQEFSDVAVPVLTSRGLLCPATERVHFSKEYGNINLEKKLPGYSWSLLSPCYVEANRDVAGWRDLFSRLGVKDGLIICKERRTLTSEELASSPWSAESAAWHQSPGEACVLDDYRCEEFYSLATAQLPGSLLQQQRMELLALLEKHWETGHCYSQYLTAQVIDHDGRVVRNTRSSFHHFLCCLEWIPAHRPTREGPQERKFLRPDSVYVTSPEVTKLLGTHVFYVDTDSSQFSRDLGMRETISVEVLIQYLKEWCVHPQEDNQEQEAEGACFTSTIQHIHDVYNYLHTNCSQSSLKELFQHTPAVFVETKRVSETWCSGRFHHLKEVCWSDTTSMFQRYRWLMQRADSPVQEPRVLAPFYSQLDGMQDFFIRLLNVDSCPNMKQYVSLLELVCSSSPMPTAEVLQDVSILYARLAQRCKCQVPGDQDGPPHKLNPSFCSTLKGMVSDMRVFPIKSNTWVKLANKPMIGDDKELEKIFKSHQMVCLLNLPPPEKKPAPKSKTGNAAAGDMKPAFNEKDRLLFLDICGIRRLSSCIRSEPLTESLRPCPSMQRMVRSVVPYIQRFLYHHDELAQVYSELADRKIAEKIKRLSFAQVGKLYIRYQLDVSDGEDEVVELQDVICLLKDEKELYIQKDHLPGKLEICSELVKLFCTESSHRKELKHFLSSLINSLDDPKALKRFLAKEDVRELPDGEERWEVPEPATQEIPLDRVPKSFSSTCSPDEVPRPAQADGEQTLGCWPPRAPLMNTGSRAGQGNNSAVEAALKMWPPPPAPKDKEPERDVLPGGRSHEGVQPLKSSGRPAELARPLSHPGQPVSISSPRPAESRPQSEGGQEGLAAPRPAQTLPSAQPAEAPGDQPTPNSTLAVPDAVVASATFQGTAAAAETPRPPLNLDFPRWNKDQSGLEDMELTCQRPTTMVPLDEQMDLIAIGEWGEQLVNSFLCDWRDSSDPGRPTHILWCNQSGESGQPYDFKVTFGAEATPPVLFIEVKSTVKKERSFIHLSANELDFALKEKERYHIFRVYSAGDAQNVRLCRIRNLAQHLHTKHLALYLFV